MLSLESIPNIVIYQIFNNKELPLRYGTWMEKDNEMVVPYNVALELAKNKGYNSVEEIIGNDFTFTLLKRKDIFSSTKSYDVCTLTLTGITYYGNEDKNYFFVREGVWDQLRSDFYEFEDNVNYQYVDFIVDEKADSLEVAQEVDELLESQESHFITKSGSQIVEKDYQNLFMIILFVCGLCLGLISVIIITHIVLKNRENKETRILDHYGYQCYLIKCVQVGLIFLCVAIIQMMFLPQICESLNTFASSLGFEYVVDNDIQRYFISWLLSLVIVLFVELFFVKLQRKVR